MTEIFTELNLELMKKALQRDNVVEYILKYGNNAELAALIRAHRPNQGINR
jgi:hypothetical protein